MVVPNESRFFTEQRRCASVPVSCENDLKYLANNGYRLVEVEKSRGSSPARQRRRSARPPRPRQAQQQYRQSGCLPTDGDDLIGGQPLGIVRRATTKVIYFGASCCGASTLVNNRLPTHLVFRRDEIIQPCPSFYAQEATAAIYRSTMHIRQAVDR